MTASTCSPSTRSTAAARALAGDVPVLALPEPTGTVTGSVVPAGRLVVLGVPRPLAPAISEAAVREFLTYAFSR